MRVMCTVDNLSHRCFIKKFNTRTNQIVSCRLVYTMSSPDKTTPKKWGEAQRKKMRELIENGLINPAHTETNKIDPYFLLDPSFAVCSIDRFRVNFRTYCTAFLQSQALKGVRRGENLAMFIN
ncbi:MAG: hypothetical protein ACI8RD_008370 [Bacillariaceae sp.]|jgi:hypothetical protein